MDSKSQAFTLLEAMVVISLLAVTAAFMVPVSGRTKNRENVNTFTEDLVSRLYVIQSNAYSGSGNCDYYVSFGGNSYQVTCLEETIEYDYPTQISNVYSRFPDETSQQLIFSKGSVIPNSDGYIVVNNEYRVVISAEGLIQYEKL